MKKRRLLHQVSQASNSKRRLDWRWKSISEAKRERLRQKALEESRKNVSTKTKSDEEDTKNSSKFGEKRKHKDRAKQRPDEDSEQLQLPKYLLY